MDNTAVANGTSGFVQGGGIRNAAFLSDAAKVLTLTGSKITGNTLIAGPGVTAAGGGLYTEFPVQIRRLGDRPEHTGRLQWVHHTTSTPTAFTALVWVRPRLNTILALNLAARRR